MYDIAIIGGGINGVGIARDAAGRGLKVLLIERGDLAQGTSSASTKLVHGGLRYLETYAFRLVREALSEREVLWAMAPHIIWPLTFVLPHQAGSRPWPLIRLGLFLYDHIGGRRLLPASRAIDLAHHPAGAPLKRGLKRAFIYADCWVDDARLVVLNAVDAAARGADVRVGTELVKARRTEGHWRCDLRCVDSGRMETLEARMLVNAAGPWVSDILTRGLGINGKSHARLVKGSHVVVPRLFDHEHAYILQNSDRRVVFAIPYERDFTLIGTTDVEVSGAPGPVSASAEEIDYLCKAASAWLTDPVCPSDVVWSYAGVRALYDDGDVAAQDVTRDFVLELEAARGEAPVLSVFGGKITTFRRLAEAALEQLSPWLANAGPAWTGGATLPGGDFPATGFEGLLGDLGREHAGLEATLLRRLVRAYGTNTRSVLEGVQVTKDLGHRFGTDLYESEVRWLMRHEWARAAEDILWRRSKLGLRLTASEARDLDGWMAAQRAVMASGQDRGLA